MGEEMRGKNPKHNLTKEEAIASLREEFLALMRLQLGYHCFVVRNKTEGFVIMPTGSVIHVEFYYDPFYRFKLAYDYYPNAKHLLGTVCLQDETITELTPEVLSRVEQEGKKYAKKHGIKTYISGRYWRKQQWANLDLFEIPESEAKR